MSAIYFKFDLCLETGAHGCLSKGQTETCCQIPMTRYRDAGIRVYRGLRVKLSLTAPYHRQNPPSPTHMTLRLPAGSQAISNPLEIAAMDEESV